MASVWTIRRSATDTKVAGVCGGIAQHWNVDPVLVRVGFAMLALSGGIGVVLYLAGWLLVPVEGRDTAPIDDLLGEQARRWPREVWVVVVVVACVVSFGALSSLSPFGFGPAVILAIIWYFGYYRNRARRAAGPGESQPPAAGIAPAPPMDQPTFTYPGPPSAFTEAAEVWRQRVVEHQQTLRQPTQNRPVPDASGSEPADDRREPAGLASALTGTPTAHAAFLSHPDPVGLYTASELEVGAPAPMVRPTRAASLSARRLRLVGLVVLGLALTGLGVADRLGVHIPLAAYFAVALAVVGLTLVAATWLGRARGILPMGFVLLVAVLATSVTGHTGAPPGWGSRPITYTAVSQLPAGGDTLDVGGLTVDLSRLVVASDVTYRAHVDLGTVKVTVPAKTNVVVTYSVDSGAVTAYGAKLPGGTDVRGTLQPDPVRPGEPTLTLDLSADVGSVEVDR